MGVRWVNGGGPSALCGGGPKKRGPFLVVGNMLISRGSNLKTFQTIIQYLLMNITIKAYNSIII